MKSLVYTNKDSSIDERSGGKPWRDFAIFFAEVFSVLALLHIYAPWNAIPGVNFLSSWLDAPFAAIIKWAALHVFHLSGIASTPHATDSRDTALGWVALLVLLVVSAVASISWCCVYCRKSSTYRIEIWMRYIIRFALIPVMLRYGIFKVFPLQMSRPSLGVLTEPVGQSSPMTLLWTLIGLSPAYQIMSGLLESFCAVLLFFRRTALLGSLLGIAIMANVVAMNLCFDVPVKLGAMLIFFSFIVLAMPDVPSLKLFFFERVPVELQTSWKPDLTSAVGKRIATSLEIATVVFCLYATVPISRADAARERANVRSPSSLSGEWHVDSAQQVQQDGKKIEAPVLTAMGQPMTALYLEPDGRAMARSADGRLWRAGATIDQNKHTLELYSGYFEGLRFQGTFRFTQADPDHLRLEPIEPSATLSTLQLTRVPLPPVYPLLETRFHWVEEWALER